MTGEIRIFWSQVQQRPKRLPEVEMTKDRHVLRTLRNVAMGPEGKKRQEKNGGTYIQIIEMLKCTQEKRFI